MLLVTYLVTCFGTYLIIIWPCAYDFFTNRIIYLIPKAGILNTDILNATYCNEYVVITDGVRMVTGFIGHL
jgi:hypothetical protein